MHGRPASPTTNRAELRRLFALAWPVTMTHLQWIALNVIDVVMVGQASTLELAYFSAGRLATWVVGIAGLGALSGVLVFAARADGAGDRAACGAIFRQAMIYSALLGVVAMVLLVGWARPILDAAGVPPDIAGGGADVLRMMGVGYPGMFVLSAAALFLEGLSRPRVAMIVTALTLPLNIALNALFVFGWFGAPQLGAAGAALGTAIANAVGAAILVGYIMRMPDADAYGIRGSWLAAWRGGAALRRFGIAPALASALENSGFAVVMAFATRLGAVPAAAFQVLISLHVVSLALSFGLASAAGVRTGNAIGAGEGWDIRRRGLLAAGVSAVSLALFSLPYLFAPDALVAPFSDDAAVIELSAAMVLLMGPFLLFDGVQLVMVFALRAAGDQVAAGAVQVAGMFLLQSAAAWLLIDRLGRGPLALIEAVIVAILSTALFGVARFWWITRASRDWSSRPATQ